MKKFLKFSVYLLMIMLIEWASVANAASVSVTKDNLEEAVEEIEKSSYVQNYDYTLSVTDNTIQIEYEGETYNVEYDLSDDPTFTIDIPITEGMTYEEYETQTTALGLPMLGYVAVCYIQGVSIEDAMTYFATSSALASFASGSSSSSYVICDDTDIDDGVTVLTDDDSTILTSEFGEHVMEYVNDVYSSSQTYSDSSDVNSYKWTIERKNVTSTSCDLVSTVAVNLDADFSEISGSEAEIEDLFSELTLVYSDITEDNADYVIRLKVGQKCVINSDEEITGYSMMGDSCVTFSDDYTTITGTSVGEKNGYLTVGDEEKSIYIIVTENTNNATLANVTITISSGASTNTGSTTNTINTVVTSGSTSTTSSTNTTNTIKTTSTTNTTNTTDTTTTTSALPQTGEKNIIFAAILGAAVIAVISSIKMKKYTE